MIITFQVKRIIPSRNNEAENLKSDKSSVRRTPTQERSKERVEKILAAAEALIVAHGVNNLQMNEIADRAAVPVASIYQYFPNRESVVGQLVDRYHANFKQAGEHLFNGVRTVPEFAERTTQFIDYATNYLITTPAYRELWCGAQGFQPLRELDWMDTLHNANLMCDTLHPLLPNLERRAILASCMVINDAARAVTLMAIHFNDQTNDIIRQYRKMIIGHIMDLERQNVDKWLNDSLISDAISGDKKPAPGSGNQ